MNGEKKLSALTLAFVEGKIPSCCTKTYCGNDNTKKDETIASTSPQVAW